MASEFAHSVITGDIVLVILVILSVVQCASSVKCYTCNGVSSPAACKQIKTCSGDQLCYMEEYEADKGGMVYYGGCATRDACVVSMHLHRAHGPSEGLPGHPGVRKCATCCRNDLCNTNICEKSVLVDRPVAHTIQRPSQNGDNVRCFTCDGVNRLEECSVTELCQRGHHCYLEVYAGANSVQTYYGGCISDLACARAGLPTHVGEKLCGVCCNHWLCNSNLCGHQIQVYNKAHMSGPRNRQCMQCYDQRLDELGSCLNSVECSSNTSRCSSVMRRENDLVTADMDCEENLPCSSSSVTPQNQMCAACCDTDNCNTQLDCSQTTQHISSTTSTSLGTTPPTIFTTNPSTSPSTFTTSTETTTSTSTPSTPTTKSTTQHAESSPVSSATSSPTALTTPTTTASSVASASTSTTAGARVYTGVECEVCQGDSCGLGTDQFSTAHCPDNIAPFCINEITNDVNGDKHIRKRCGSVLECKAALADQVSKSDVCLNFDPSATYGTSFHCKYCCTTSNCNSLLVPDNSTQTLD